MRTFDGRAADIGRTNGGQLTVIRRTFDGRASLICKAFGALFRMLSYRSFEGGTFARMKKKSRKNPDEAETSRSETPLTARNAAFPNTKTPLRCAGAKKRHGSAEGKRGIAWLMFRIKGAGRRSLPRRKQPPRHPICISIFMKSSSFSPRSAPPAGTRPHRRTRPPTWWRRRTRPAPAPAA